MHYIERHDKIAANTLEIYKEYTLVRDQKLYEHFPDTVVHNDTVAVHWNTPCHSGRYIKENRTDTVMQNHQVQGCRLMGVAAPSQRNASLKRNLMNTKK